MKVRVLIEQKAHGERPYLASGEEYNLDNDHAKELLDRGDAEPVARKDVTRAEKRPSAKRGEKR